MDYVLAGVMVFALVLWQVCPSDERQLIADYLVVVAIRLSAFSLFAVALGAAVVVFNDWALR